MFLFLGTALGGGIAAGLGYAFAAGTGESLQFEIIVYTVVGLIAGFALGLILHLLTYRPHETTDPSAAMPGMGGGFGTFNSGVAGGIVLMVGAVAWFVLGYFLAHKIFFYPPILFVIGLIAMIRGLFFSK